MATNAKYVPLPYPVGHSIMSPAIIAGEYEFLWPEIMAKYPQLMRSILETMSKKNGYRKDIDPKWLGRDIYIETLCRKHETGRTSHSFRVYFLQQVENAKVLTLHQLHNWTKVMDAYHQHLSEGDNLRQMAYAIADKWKQATAKREEEKRRVCKPTVVDLEERAAQKKARLSKKKSAKKAKAAAAKAKRDASNSFLFQGHSSPQ